MNKKNMCIRGMQRRRARILTLIMWIMRKKLEFSFHVTKKIPWSRLNSAGFILNRDLRPRQDVMYVVWTLHCSSVHVWMSEQVSPGAMSDFPSGKTNSVLLKCRARVLLTTCHIKSLSVRRTVLRSVPELLNDACGPNHRQRIYHWNKWQRWSSSALHSQGNIMSLSSTGFHGNPQLSLPSAHSIAENVLDEATALDHIGLFLSCFTRRNTRCVLLRAERFLTCPIVHCKFVIIGPCVICFVKIY